MRPRLPSVPSVCPERDAESSSGGPCWQEGEQGSVRGGSVFILGEFTIRGAD